MPAGSVFVLLPLLGMNVAVVVVVLVLDNLLVEVVVLEVLV